MKTKGYVIQNGRDFVERDFKEFRKVVLLDDVAVQTLFPGDNPVGKTIELRGEPFTVVGCIRKSDAFEPVINSLEDYYTYNQNTNGIVLIPDSTWPVVYNYDEPEEVSVSGVVRQTDEFCRKKSGGHYESGRKSYTWQCPRTENLQG